MYHEMAFHCHRLSYKQVIIITNYSNQDTIVNEREKLHRETKCNLDEPGFRVTLCINNITFISCNINIKFSMRDIVRVLFYSVNILISKLLVM